VPDWLGFLIAVALAIEDAVETYIGVFIMGFTEFDALTRMMISAFGPLGIVLGTALTILLAYALFRLTYLDGLAWVFGEAMLNTLNTTRAMVVISNLLLITLNTQLPIIAVYGIGTATAVLMNARLARHLLSRRVREVLTVKVGEKRVK